MESDLKESLKKVNSVLREKRDTGALPGDVRAAIEDKLGDIIKKSRKQKPDWIKTVLAVDGSLNSYGSSFPYIINFFRSLSLFSAGNRRISLSDIYTPILDMDSYNEDDDNEEAMKEIRDRKMAEMEVEVAIEGIRQFSPSLVIFDGGFLRYLEKAKDVFDSYIRLCREKGIVSVGVIEEIGTFDMARRLRGSFGFPVEDDRELLFGALEPYEILKLKGDAQFKKGLYTAFARPCLHPNPVAYDFLEEDRESALDTVNFLMSLTPASSRGIPLILDIVDGEAKINSEEVKVMVDSFLDSDIKEGLFRPQRDRRVML